MNSDERNDEIEIDLLEILYLLLGKWWIILICVILGAGGGFAYSQFGITPQYVSYTSVYILNKSNNSTLTFSDTQLANQITNDYETIITSRYVLEQVMEQFGINESYESFRGRVSVSNEDDTRVLSIGVKDPDPRMAKRLADSLRETSSEHIRSVMDLDAVKLVDEANLAEAPSEPSKKKWTLMCGAVAFMLSCGFLIVRYLMDDTIKTTEDVERYLGLSTLSLVPNMERSAGKGGGHRRKGKVRRHEGTDWRNGHAADEEESRSTVDLVEMRLKQVISETGVESRKVGERRDADSEIEEGSAGLQNQRSI